MSRLSQNTRDIIDDNALASVEALEESLRLIDDLKFFLATAPANWQENQIIRRYYLNHEEGFVSCVYWKNLYFITGTDIVRCIAYKFIHFGRVIDDRKKFEEGIFSDLRSLRCGIDAVLENPKSEFLQFLFKNSCLKTQKKQKVFFWFSVPHDKLFADALERDLKKENSDSAPTTKAVREPAISFKCKDNVPLYEQLAGHLNASKKSLDDTAVEPVPIVKKEEPEQDDDFPLDYFQAADDIVNEPFREMAFDPSTFVGSPIAQYYNEEYLIEQALPLEPTPYYPPPQYAVAPGYYEDPYMDHQFVGAARAPYYDYPTHLPVDYGVGFPPPQAAAPSPGSSIQAPFRGGVWRRPEKPKIGTRMADSRGVNKSLRNPNLQHLVLDDLEAEREEFDFFADNI